MRSTLALSAAALVALAGATVLNLRLAADLQVKPYDVTNVPQGEFARYASLGQRGFVSDLYWLSAVQYIGDHRADERGWDKLLPLVDLVTDLDPRHGYAYQTAGIVLSAAGRLDESNTILKKGIDEGPRYWTFPYYLSFNHWFYLGDYAKGAEWADVAARTPGASPNISHLAVSLRSKSGTPEQAIELLLQLRETVKDEVTASRLEEQLKLAVLERDAQALEKAVQEYEARTGAPFPAGLGLQMLVATGLVARVPPDPFGGEYVWDAEAREVRSSVNSFRFRLKDRPRRPEFQFQVDPNTLKRKPAPSSQESHP